MATLKTTLGMVGGFSLNSTQKGEVRCIPIKLVLGASDEPTEGDVIHVGKLPALHVPVFSFMAATDLDTGTPAIVLDLGILDEKQDPDDTTDADCFLDASTIAQAGGVAYGNNAAGLILTPVNYDRIITLTWTTDAATFAAGTLVGGVFVRNRISPAFEAGEVPA